VLGLAKLFQGFRPKPFLCLEHNLLALLTHIVLKVMTCYVFKVRFNCRIVATKTVEEIIIIITIIIIAFWLLKKLTEIPVSPGLFGLKASDAPVHYRSRTVILLQVVFRPIKKEMYICLKSC